MIDITPVIEAVVALLLAVLTYILIPWLKSKYAAQQTADLLRWVDIAVAAAEQTMRLGAVKKDFVSEFLRSKGYSVNETELDAAIEAAVLKLHKELDYGNNCG